MKRILFLFFAMITCSFAGDVSLSWGGALNFETEGLQLSPMAFTMNWEGRTGSGFPHPDAAGNASFYIAAGAEDGEKINARCHLSAEENGEISVSYRFCSEKDIPLQALVLSMPLPCGRFSGWTLVGDSTKEVFPKKHGKTHFFAEMTRQFSLLNAQGNTILQFAFQEPVFVMAQDDRAWGSDQYTVRFFAAGKRDEKIYLAAETYTLDFRASGAAAFQIAESRPVQITAGKDWIPLRVKRGITEGSALDFSRLRGGDSPAGKYGRVVIRNGHFEFENLPGEVQRFYGMNMVGTANIPEETDAEALAVHLSRMGYNAIRFHHHERHLVAADGVSLNPENMRKFDALMAACIRHGLYLTTDLFVSRMPISYRSIGIDQDGNVGMNEFKALLPVHEGAFQNFLVFSRNFLNHVNPCTGRRIADEPAMAWISLVNEGNLGNQDMRFFRQYDCWKEAWENWLAGKKKTDPEHYADVTEDFPKALYGGDRDMQKIAFLQFLTETEMKFAERVTAFLRNEIGCRALLTNMNCWYYPANYQLARAQSYDYVDDHFYVDHPSFLEKPWRLPSSCPNVNPVQGKQMGAQQLTARRIFGKPFCISEYNYSAPGRFRGIGGILLGAAGALQDWDGLWRFAWSHDREGAVRPDRKKMTYFDMAGDPLSCAAERASICLYLRRDLKPLKKTLSLHLPPEKLLERGAVAPGTYVSWVWASWFAKIGCAVSDTIPEGAMNAGIYPEVYETKDSDIRELLFPDRAVSQPLPAAGDGAIVQDSEKGSFSIRTDRTCGGFAEQGKIQAGGLSAEIGTTAATVWVSSLSEEPISSAKRLLLTHLTDVQNSGITYADRDRTILTDWGTLPHLMRTGCAQISLMLSQQQWTVYALETDGTRRFPVKSRYENGVLSFTAATDADPENAVFLYEIIAER